jgi:AcrR family transcriptional regulator
MSGPERREGILAAAREQFAKHGFHGAGTAAIARAAGCSEAILYRHFASKRDLLLAVLEQEVRDRLDSGRVIAPPPGVDISAVLPETLRERLADEDMVVTTRRILLALSMTDDPDVRETMKGLFETIREPITRAIAAAQATGGIRDDIAPETLNWLFHGLFMVAAVRNAVAQDGVALPAVDAATILVDLLRPPA